MDCHDPDGSRNDGTLEVSLPVVVWSLLRKSFVGLKYDLFTICIKPGHLLDKQEVIVNNIVTGWQFTRLPDAF